jgi:ribonuclease P protein subunit RPR2
MKNKRKLKKTAREHVKSLFSQAAAATSKLMKNRYVHLARKMAMRHKTGLSKDQKRQFCKHCYAHLDFSKGDRVRIHKSRVIMFCSSCKKHTRIPVKK